MIPNAVSSVGPYAELWSHLKSIDHALGRALDLGSASSLTELDKDRLHALVDLLQIGVAPQQPELDDLLSSPTSTEPAYGSSINLRERLATVPEFEAWKKTSRQGFQIKLQGLIDTLKGYLQAPTGQLFPKNAPAPELHVMQAIVRALLIDAEAALQ